VPGGEAGGEPSGGGGAPTEPTGTAISEEAWQQALAALNSIRVDGARIAQTISDKLAAGQTLTSEASQLFDAGYAAAERVKQRVAVIVEGSPEIVSALDATAAPGGGVSGLGAYLGDLGSAATDVLAVLRSPLNEGALSAYDYQTLDELGQIAQTAGQIAAKLGGAAWARLVELLSLPVVRAAAVTYIGVKGAGDALNADTAAYRDINTQLNDLVARGELTAEEAQGLRPGAPVSGAAIVALGVVALGGLALFLRRKKT
jgi:hypothetical protein